jgi:hypothetical protein
MTKRKTGLMTADEALDIADNVWGKAGRDEYVIVLAAEVRRLRDCGPDSACGTVGEQCQKCLRAMFHREAEECARLREELVDWKERASRIAYRPTVKRPPPE